MCVTLNTRTLRSLVSSPDEPLVEHEFETTGSNRAQTHVVSQRGRRENPGKVLGETEVAGMERVTGYPLKMKE